MSTLESNSSDASQAGEPYSSPDTDESYSGRSPEEIESAIDHTREELSRTLDALESRLSFRERLHSATGSARELGLRVARAGARYASPNITTVIRLDHAHALALFRRLKPWTSTTRKQAITSSLCLALEVHAQLEEEIFYPALRATAGGSEVLDRSVPEHDEMKSLIGKLRTLEIDDPAFDDTFSLLMRTVLHHVADEESVLLPQAESLMRDRLGELGIEMTRRRLELLRPHWSEVASTTARSFPVATALGAAAILGMVWMLLRPRSDPRTL